MKTKKEKNYFNISNHISIHNFPILFLFNEIEARDYIITAPIYLKFYIIPVLILLYLWSYWFNAVIMEPGFWRRFFTALITDGEGRWILITTLIVLSFSYWGWKYSNVAYGLPWNRSYSLIFCFILIVVVSYISFLLIAKIATVIFFIELFKTDWKWAQWLRRVTHGGGIFIGVFYEVMLIYIVFRSTIKVVILYINYISYVPFVVPVWYYHSFCIVIFFAYGIRVVWKNFFPD